VVSYNPNKRGRPSHSYHCYMMANLRLVLAAEVAPGNQHTSKHSSPRLWALLDGLAAGLRPWLIRGDVGFGNEPVMREAERRHQPYLFKLRLTKGDRGVGCKRMGSGAGRRGAFSRSGASTVPETLRRKAAGALFRCGGYPRNHRLLAMCVEDPVPFDRSFHIPQTGFGAVSIDVVDGSRGKPSIPDQIDRVGDQVRIVGGVLSLKDVMEMRRHGFDDRIPERLQRIDQE
jgi:hypothetical protein